MRRSVLRTGIAGVALAATLAGCGGYGGETVGEESPGVVKADGEYCQMTLPDGWTWYPAQWAAESPDGTRVLFEDARYGRPREPEWSEVIETKIARARDRNPEATITETESSLTIDYGENAGLTYLQRFDTVGCQVTFSNAQETRATEFDQWQQIMASFERISPDPTFTPPSS